MFFFYRVITTIFYPIFIILVLIRKILNKEDPIRYKEKIFSSSFNPLRKKKSNLVWFHAASVGEMKSILPIIKILNKKHKNLEFLITTVTLSSANLVKEEIQKFENIHHRFFPLDINFLIKKFLEAWKPNLIFLVDSEIWPNLILAAKKNKIKLAIINARITKKTFRRWMLFPKTAKNIFCLFDLCLSSSNETKNYLTKLNAKNIFFFGNIKFVNGTVDDATRKPLNVISKDAKIWMAVSTHKNEEEFCLKTHLLLMKNLKNLTTIIAPRHINRVNIIKRLCEELNLTHQIFERKDNILEKKDVVIINSYGILSKFLSQVDSVFIGKSTNSKFKKVGGQNPIEAAKFGCRIYHGPYVYNFKEIYEILNKNTISFEVTNPNELANKLELDFKDRKNNKEKNTILIKEIENITVNQTMDCINKYFFNEN